MGSAPAPAWYPRVTREDVIGLKGKPVSDYTKFGIEPNANFANDTGYQSLKSRADKGLLSENDAGTYRVIQGVIEQDKTRDAQRTQIDDLVKSIQNNITTENVINSSAVAPQGRDVNTRNRASASASSGRGGTLLTNLIQSSAPQKLGGTTLLGG